jgi:sterol desaturase/sphingolipid hydroxylase (fatty acid hydroxylase superfamily)
LFNQFFVMLPAMALAGWTGLAFGPVRVPWFLFPVHAYLLGAVHDTVFYFGHRALHLPWLFRFHALHHRSSGAVAASSLYMSPLDFVVEILLPYGAFLCLVATDLRFDVALAAGGSLLAMYEHSGYCFTTALAALDSRPHLSHHVGRLNGSFSEGVGSPGYMDRLFGTQLRDATRVPAVAMAQQQ